MISQLFVFLVNIHVSGCWQCFDDWGQLQHDPYTYDPCLDGNHHLLTDHTRSADYYNPDSELIHNDFDYFNYYSDNNIWEKNGWYRSMIPGAEDVALAKPEYGHCQTDKQWYIDAENHFIYDHHQESDLYNIYLSHSDHGCCWIVCMKPCDHFNVYQLTGYYHYWNYDGRFCFGGPGECRDDDELCKRLFEQRNRPQITYTATEKKLGDGMCKEEVEFECKVPTWVDGTDVNELKFAWTIQNLIIYEEIKQRQDEISTLTVDKIQNKGITTGNFELECTVQWTSSTDSTYGNTVSTTFFVGIEMSQSNLVLTEGQSPGSVQLKSSIPLGCEYKCSEGETHICEVEVPIIYSSNKNNEIAFQFDDNYAVSSSCDTSPSVTAQYGSGEFLNVPMMIYPKDDGKYDGTQKLAIQIGLASAQSMWNGLSFDLDVLVHDINRKYSRGISCSFYNDPHAKNFDRQRFEVQLAGFFKVMRHLQYPIDIEAYFVNYRRYTGVCGVAVRSGGYLYVIRVCRQPIIAKYYQCDSSLGSESAPLIVNRHGRGYRIYLPTGTMVEFRERRLVIYPSASDQNNVEGICGNYNGNNTDDFKLKDTDDLDSNTYAPNDFSNSWRVEEKKSLFQGDITDYDSRTFENRDFCECNSQGVRKCSPLPSSSNNQKGTNVLPGGACRQNKRSIVYSDYVPDEDEFMFDYNPSYVAPIPQWNNGWSESLAEDFCNEYFLTNSLLQSCADLIDTKNITSSCIEDIHITGTTDYAKTQLDMLLSQCIEEVQKYDLITVDEDSNYTNPYQEILDSVCYSDCNGNGMCENGVCICDGNYTEYDCSVDKNHIPTLEPLPFSGLCDKLSRPCQDTGVYADLLLDTSNLVCQVQVKDVNYSPLSEAVTYTGVMEHYQKVFCHIPEHTMPYVVSIALTNNNQDFSEPQHLLIYHSTCWHCNLGSGCTKRETSCVIDQSCFAEGETNPENGKEHCNPEADEFGWTEVSSTAAPSSSLKRGAIIGIAVAASVVLIMALAITVVVCKHKGNKKATRVASEIDFDKRRTILPKSLEDNCNGLPPQKAQVDFKTLSLAAGTRPNNRLEPLNAMLAVDNQQASPSIGNEENIHQVKPMFLQREALPPVNADDQII